MKNRIAPVKEFMRNNLSSKILDTDNYLNYMEE